MKSLATYPVVLALAALTTAQYSGSYTGPLPVEPLPTDNPANPNPDPNSAVIITLTPTNPLPPPPTQTGCPTVTTTGVLCPTCPVPACLGLATVTQRCGCPEAIPTVTVNFPCEDNCAGVWCTTVYETVPLTGTCTVGGTPPAPTFPSASGGGGGGKNGTATTSATSTRSTSSVVEVNAAGRMEMPFGWLGRLL
ncbi:hypothetical protein QBC34DRAFT_75946 [Podospora aff. communis PSN243]|uniref:Extracellular membrane protein CFEM domain-containing protein n=1 Tax=Podospora aff. communis PSN243 TaxID=3040156 RepID=A0AAV9GRV9_9PEZI|nr:hypothetical protein QBC34DRAFT_75946 [Podospora aff. communis PSN243]